MNRHVNAIAGRLSLRAPQRESLEILDRVTEIAPPKKDTDVSAALAAIRSEYPSVTDFEREFPSLCFALATGVGKTRLMGAFISYLHLAHGIDNFFVLAPNLTIYNKLIADFTPNTPKYVFKGIAEFATVPPEIITGDNYESRGPMLSQLVSCKVNIFNISKINSEVRGGKSPRIKRLSEYIGQSYFDYLAGLPDLVLLMDESHRYRASAGVRAINELKPILGLELTATPIVETARGTVPFQNVVLAYPLGQAMADGFVKEPAVVTRKDFDPGSMDAAGIERMKLDDAIRMHEETKVHLETYAREHSERFVKPFVLIIARDTTHARQLQDLIRSAEFFGGRYAERVLQVDSSQTGADEDRMVQTLLKVEDPDEPTEIVIHVNMLKEGWDVTNLYTIVPLRAANARVLIEQSIGRGLRLPYGRRTGVAAVDRLSIVAHDRFQEIVDEANRPGSVLRLATVEYDPGAKPVTTTVVSQPNVERQLGISSGPVRAGAEAPANVSLFQTPEERQVAAIAYEVIGELETRPDLLPGVGSLRDEAVRDHVLREVRERYRPEQPGLEGLRDEPDFAEVIALTAEVVIEGSIDIPRIYVAPKSAVRSGFRPFKLDLSRVNYQTPSEDLWVQYLRTGQTERIGPRRAEAEESRAEDSLVFELIDYDDVAYDSHSDLLYDLAGQVVAHLGAYLTEEDVRKVLRVHRRALGRLIHGQMQEHAWEDAVEYETTVAAGFKRLKASAYAKAADFDLRVSPPDKSNMGRYVFGGFKRCLYPSQKFDSEPERILAVILDREAEKWFRPAADQFELEYPDGVEHRRYQPDFVAETTDTIYMLEPKRRTDLGTSEVLAKKAAAVLWCEQASTHAATYGGKPWRYALIPHDVIAENRTIEGLVAVGV